MKMKNFAVIIDQDKTVKDAEDNLETRINPKLSKARKNRALLRKLVSTADNTSGTIGTALMAFPSSLVGLPGVSMAAGGVLVTGKDKLKSMYKNYGTSGFNKSHVFKVDPEKFYIIDFVDNYHINILGNNTGYSTRDDAKRDLTEGNYIRNRQGIIRINKGITLLNNYPNKFKKVEYEE